MWAWRSAAATRAMGRALWPVRSLTMRRPVHRRPCGASLVVILLLGIAGLATAQDAPRPTPLDYNRDVRPILSDKCFRCHGPDHAHREADLRLDRRDDAVAERGGSPAILPGDPDASELYARITA